MRGNVVSYKVCGMALSAMLVILVAGGNLAE